MTKTFSRYIAVAWLLVAINTVNADHGLYRAVFSLPQVQKELQVTQKETDHLLSLNREYIDAAKKIASNFEASWQDKSQATQDARQVAENQLLETLSFDRRKRLDQLVFSTC